MSVGDLDRTGALGVESYRPSAAPFETAERPPAPSGRAGRGFLACGVLVAAVAFGGLPHLGDRDFWPPDEARYGEVSREMFTASRPTVPHLNGVVYPDKPPVFFWTVCAVARMRGGVDEFAGRFPSVLGAALMSLAAFALARRAFGDGTALLAGLLTVSTGEALVRLHAAQLDPLFGGVIAWSVLFLWRATESGRTTPLAASALLAGVAILIKGPLVLVHLAAAAGGVACAGRGRASLARRGLLLVPALLAPSAAWAAFAYLRLEGESAGAGRDYFATQLGLHVVTRAATGIAHEKAWSYYLKSFPAVMAPFSPLLLLFLWRGTRRALDAPRRAVVVFSAVWLAATLGVQSCVPGKRSLYFVPLYPAFGVLCAAAVALAAEAAARACGVWLAVTGAVTAGLGAAAWTFGRDLDLVRDLAGFADATLPSSWIAGAADSRPATLSARLIDAGVPFDGAGRVALERALALGGGPLLAAGAASLAVLAVGARRASAALAALGLLIGGGLLVNAVPAPFDAAGSRRPVAEAARDALARRGGDAAPVAIFRHLDEGVPYYLRRPVPEIAWQLNVSDPAARERGRAEAAAFLRRPGAVLIVRRPDYDRFGLSDVAPAKIVAEVRAGDTPFLIIEGGA